MPRQFFHSRSLEKYNQVRLERDSVQHLRNPVSQALPCAFGNVEVSLFRRDLNARGSNADHLASAAISSTTVRSSSCTSNSLAPEGNVVFAAERYRAERSRPSPTKGGLSTRRAIHRSIKTCQECRLCLPERSQKSPIAALIGTNTVTSNR